MAAVKAGKVVGIVVTRPGSGYADVSGIKSVLLSVPLYMGKRGVGGWGGGVTRGT